MFDPVDGAVERARALIDQALPELERLGLLRGANAAAVGERITGAGSLKQALADVAHVQENAPEKIEVKRALFAELDPLAPPAAVLASSTSAIRASAFTEALKGRARCLVAHPINPPHLVPLVELVPAPWTDPRVISRTRALMAAVGQAPITLKREIEGFVANRMQVALMNEAFRLVETGVCDVADVDTAIAEGIGLRWAFIGPFEVGDLNAPAGIADYCARFGGMFTTIGKDQAEPPKFSDALIANVERQRRAVLPAGQLPARSAWRDQRLAEIAVWKNQSVRASKP